MSIIKHVTLQKIVAHDFRYDPRIIITFIHFSFIFHNGMHKTMLTGTGVDVSQLRNVIAIKLQTETKRV